MAIGEAMALGQLGLGLTQMIMGDRAREQQVYNQAYETTLNNQLGQFRAEQQNKQILAAFGAKVDYVKNQIENNFLAAQAAWTSEQMRLNEVYDVAAYKSQAMQKMLTEAMGTSAAREVYGKSARRGALVSTLGAYGRTRAQMVDQLMSESSASKIRMEQTEKQFKAQNKLAINQVSVLPSAATFTPTPLPGTSSGGFGQTAMQALGIGMSAFQTGWDMTPRGQGSTFFGIRKE